ncbi:hypothetical protein M406DRAFT_326562 [Cryphonectria parasitica EP155]|uniref:Uncharacterized protein n=1 Tax=Cryphonectria parasitica (strain ATCC 38755 / EP155) TaxID=660469 RepID=A0A9P4YE17_CRYP1|nr:uncharacterized protein M406DRAFT_326562 [Cryphonectria parasitica EP155]KAF3771164.1 hypothetical protein M406DRAFT_326562 [Cryphonectria parasitica EP155]
MSLMIRRATLAFFHAQVHTVWVGTENSSNQYKLVPTMASTISITQSTRVPEQESWLSTKGSAAPDYTPASKPEFSIPPISIQLVKLSRHTSVTMVKGISPPIRKHIFTAIKFCIPGCVGRNHEVHEIELLGDKRQNVKMALMLMQVPEEVIIIGN